MKKYIDEIKKIEELEKLLATLKSKIKGHENEYPAIMKAINGIREILEKHKHSIDISPEFI